MSRIGKMPVTIPKGTTVAIKGKDIEAKGPKGTLSRPISPMVEIKVEAEQVVVEATVERLTEIYMRQPPLQELIGNVWLLVSAIDPESGELSVFRPEQGFIPWQGEEETLPEVANSSDWYRGHRDPLSPALIRQPRQPRQPETTPHG